MEQAPESRLSPTRVTSSRHETELEIAKRLFRVGTRVERWNVNRTRTSSTGEDLELSLAQLACLYHIRQGIDTPGELAKMLLVTPTAITALVDRLVRRGYVNREHDTVDRRRVILAVTEAGHQASEATVQVVAESLAEMLVSLTEQEVEQISTGMLLLETALDRAQPLKEFRESQRG